MYEWLVGGGLWDTCARFRSSHHCGAEQKETHERRTRYVSRITAGKGAGHPLTRRPRLCGGLGAKIKIQPGFHFWRKYEAQPDVLGMFTSCQSDPWPPWPKNRPFTLLNWSKEWPYGRQPAGEERWYNTRHCICLNFCTESFCSNSITRSGICLNWCSNFLVDSIDVK